MKDVVYKVPIDGFQYLRKDGANYYKIASGETHTIIENREMFVTDSIEIVGDLTIEGRLTLFRYESIKLKQVHTVTSDTTLGTYHDVIRCDASSNTITITLPTAVGNTGKVYYIKAVDETYQVDVDGNGSETIDDELTQIVPYPLTMAICSNGTGWDII